jgi:ubiquitin carboxyl-terminal hydrolase 14
MDALCSDELRDRLAVNRAIQKERDDKRIDVEKAEFEEFKAAKMDDENMDTLKLTKEFRKIKK